MRNCLQQTDMVDRMIRSVKEQCVNRHRFQKNRHAARAVCNWAQIYFRR